MTEVVTAERHPGRSRDHQQRTVAIPHKHPVCGFEDGFGGKVVAHNRAGVACGNAAGMGTDHLGTGRCKFHGGTSQNVDAPQFRHGLSSSVKHPEFQAKLAEYISDDQIFDLRHEIKYLKAIKDVLLERDSLDSSVRAIDKIGKLTEQLHNIEVGRKYVISIENLNLLISSTIEIVRRHVIDEHTRALIAEDLMRVQLFSNDKAKQHTSTAGEDGGLLLTSGSEGVESGVAAGGDIIEGVEVEELDSSTRPETKYRSL